jgi:hypothetical protein
MVITIFFFYSLTSSVLRINTHVWCVTMAVRRVERAGKTVVKHKRMIALRASSAKGKNAIVGNYYYMYIACI